MSEPSVMGAIVGIPSSVFWPYFAGCSLFTLGVIAMNEKELAKESGMDKIIPFGRLFFAVPMAAFGSQHFTSTRFIVNMVPSWIPWHLFWIYFVGTALIAAALSIVTGKRSWLAATLLGIMFFLFVVLMHIPTFVRNPSDRIQFAVVMRDLSFSGGALALAGQTAMWRTYGSKIITLARFFIAIPVIFFGLENVLHPGFVPTVSLNKLTPAWIPGHSFWGYPIGLAFVVLGLGLLLNRKAHMAATWLGIAVLLAVLIIYMPILIANLPDVANGLNYLVDTLALSGTALLLAGALAKTDPAPASKVSVAAEELLVGHAKR